MGRLCGQFVLIVSHGFVPIAVVARPNVGISTKDTKNLTAYTVSNIQTFGTFLCYLTDD